MKRRETRFGFTLVELLVVIAIIGILISMLLPAVQQVREAARRAKCQNQIRQMSIAWHNHESSMGHFPTGGWGWGWVGDGEQGFGVDQPGGWMFNILPFMDANNSFDQADSDDGREQLIGTPLEFINCPSRRQGKFAGRYGNYNAPFTEEVARSDYAANAGSQSRNEIFSGPSSLAQGMDPSYNWPNTDDHNGICYQRSTVKFVDIRAGTSNVLMLGEKYLELGSYESGRSAADNEHAFSGYNNDNFRTTWHPPLQDKLGYGSSRIFGSNHPTVFNISRCDASVHAVSYEVDEDLWRAVGSRKRGAGNLE